MAALSAATSHSCIRCTALLCTVPLPVLAVASPALLPYPLHAIFFLFLGLHAHNPLSSRVCTHLAHSGGLCQGGALKEALRRYERLWLPLIAALAAAPGSSVRQGYSQLVPPLDVAFLWHLHRLQLSVYEEDCCQLKGRDGRSLTAALHVTAQQVSLAGLFLGRQRGFGSRWPFSKC